VVEVELQLVGQNLTELRSARGLSLAKLADLTGYTRSYLSRIERGDSIPSISALASVAAALGVEMAALFEAAAGPRLHVTRSSERLELRTGLTAADETPNRYTVLGSHGNEGAYTALIHRNPPNRPSMKFRHFGERFLLVLAGSVRVTLGEEFYDLSVDDCLHYGSHEEHTVIVTSEAEAIVLTIVSPAFF